MIDAPQGFESLSATRGTLIVDSRHREIVAARGLCDPSTWATVLDAGQSTTGRGVTARVELEPGFAVVMKKMRRGGALAPFWRDRFVGTGRLVGNLTIPLQAAAAGVPTAAPVALLLIGGPPGLYQAWLAVEEIPDAEDLMRRFRRQGSVERSELRSAVLLVRAMHDAGLEHRDLNLGNLLLRPGAGGGHRCFVIDLDGAVWHGGPLEVGLRERGLRRLERSLVKTMGGDDADLEAARDAMYEDYAGADGSLAERLAAGRAAGRRQIELHRRRWQ